MANWANLATTENYATLLGSTRLDGMLGDAATMFIGVTPTNTRTNTVRWDTTNNRFEKWSGTVWVELFSSGYKFTSGFAVGDSGAAAPSTIFHGSDGGYAEFDYGASPAARARAIGTSQFALQGWSGTAWWSRIGWNTSNLLQISAEGALATGLELGNQNGYNTDTYLDFHTTATPTDYEARIFRVAGTNGIFDVVQTGSGGMRIQPGSGGLEVYGTSKVTSAAATAFAVGPNGTTNPTLLVDASVASAVTGVKIQGLAAATSQVNVSAISSAADAYLALDAKGTGGIDLNAVGTGPIGLRRAATAYVGLTVSPGQALTLTSATVTGGTLSSATLSGTSKVPATLVRNNADSAALFDSSDVMINGTVPLARMQRSYAEGASSLGVCGVDVGTVVAGDLVEVSTAATFVLSAAADGQVAYALNKTGGTATVTFAGQSYAPKMARTTNSAGAGLSYACSTKATFKVTVGGSLTIGVQSRADTGVTVASNDIYVSALVLKGS